LASPFDRSQSNRLSGEGEGLSTGQSVIPKSDVATTVERRNSGGYCYSYPKFVKANTAISMKMAVNIPEDKLDVCRPTIGAYTE
jgi:hypothetical protein